MSAANLKTVLMGDKRHAGGTPLVCAHCATLVRVIAASWPHKLCQQCVARTFLPFTHDHWHAWQGTAGVLLSNELSKELREFKTTDDCINWLFTSGYKIAARAMNTHAKAAQ